MGLCRRSRPPPQPDPAITEAARANVAASREMADIARENLAFSRDQYADQRAELDRLRPTFDRLAGQQIEGADLAMRLTREAADDYRTTYRPIEQRVAADALAAGSEAEQARAAGLAGADVQRNIDLARGANERALASMGVRPDSGRFAGQNRTEAILAAAARAGAETSARADERLRGDSLRAGVASFGRGAQSTAFGGIGAAGQAAGAAAGAAGVGLNARTAIGQGLLANRANVQVGLGNAANVNLGAADIFGRLHDQALEAHRIRSEGRNALTGALGNLGGMALGFLSDEKAKEGKRPFSGGGARRAIERMRVERWRYKPGTEADDGGKPHAGTYAQDFRRATGLGDGKSIPVGDAIGVTMAATKELSKDVRSLRRDIAKMGSKT